MIKLVKANGFSIHYIISKATTAMLILTPSLLLAFPIKVVSYHIGLTTASWMYLSLREKSFFKFRQLNFLVLLPLANFFILLLGLLYTSNIEMGLKTIETKITLLVFPLIIFSGYDLLKNIRKENILIIYSLSVFAVSLFVLVYTFFSPVSIAGAYSFKNLSSAINIHPGYYSLYVGFSIIVLINQLPSYTKWIKLAIAFIILFLFVFNLLLVARMPLIGLMVCIFLYLLFVRKHTIILLLFAVIPLFVFSIGYQNPDWSERILTPLRMVLTGDFADLKLFTNDRVQEFTCTIELLQSNIRLFIGFGTGDDNDALFQCYSKNGYDWVLSQKYNSHNQYLQSTLQNGIMSGLLCFLLITAPLFAKKPAIRTELEFVLFSCLFALFSLTEATLEVQKGVVFFVFFYGLLTYYHNQHLMACQHQP
jgi:O-antigen ligase